MRQHASGPFASSKKVALLLVYRAGPRTAKRAGSSPRLGDRHGRRIMNDSRTVVPFPRPVPRRYAMHRAVFALVTAVGLIFLAGARAQEEKKGQDGLKGTWTAVSLERGGQSLPLDQLKE